MHTASGSANVDGAWWVPVSFSSRSQYSDPSAESPVRGWLKPSSTLDIALPAKSASEWLIVNLDRTGKPGWPGRQQCSLRSLPHQKPDVLTFILWRRLLPRQLRHGELAAAGGLPLGAGQPAHAGRGHEGHAAGRRARAGAHRPPGPLHGPHVRRLPARRDD